MAPTDAHPQTSNGEDAIPVSAIADGAREKAVQLREGSGEGARDILDRGHAQAGDAHAVLADRLERGAEAVRARVAPHAAAGASNAGERRRGDVGAPVAGTLERTAVWLREHDLAEVGDAVFRRQVHERPGRVALVAVGAGFALGRASTR